MMNRFKENPLKSFIFLRINKNVQTGLILPNILTLFFISSRLWSATYGKILNVFEDNS